MRIYFVPLGIGCFVLLSGCLTAKRVGGDSQILGPIHVHPELPGTADVLPESEAIWTLRRSSVDTLPRLAFDLQWLDRIERNLLANARRRGFLHAEVHCEPDSMWGRRIGMNCLVNTGRLAAIGQLNWEVMETGLPVETLQANSLLKSGAPFDAEVLEKERIRIAQTARSIGYAGFQEAYVTFVADTTESEFGRDVEVTIRLLPATRTIDGDLRAEPHAKFRFGEVRFNQVTDKGGDTLKISILDHLNSIEQGMVYNSIVLEETYRRLARLPSVRRVEMRMEDGVANNDSMDVEIWISSRPNMALELEVDMTRRDAAYGPMAQLTWQHLNPSRMGDQLELSASGGISSVKPFVYDATSLIPNSGEWSLNLDYQRPGFFPLRLAHVRPSTDAQTLMGLNIRRESRPDYVRRNFGFLWGNRFIENPALSSLVRLDWLEITHTDIETTAAFQSWLDEEASEFIRSRFADYSSVLTRVVWSRPELRISMEWAGQTLRTLAPTLGLPENASGQFLLGGVPFAQFLRAEAQRSWHLGTGRIKHACRILAGSGWAGKNFETLPFDRAFFGGGVQGMRGWGARELGPGSVKSEDGNGAVQGLGDMRIETSYELRWKWTDMWMLTTFVDIGNVWLHGSKAPASATFMRGGKWATVACNIGLGLRLDFDFFLLRLDAGLRLHDPTQPESRRWWRPSQSNGALHLGLGHAF